MTLTVEEVQYLARAGVKVRTSALGLVSSWEYRTENDLEEGAVSLALASERRKALRAGKAFAASLETITTALGRHAKRTARHEANVRRRRIAALADRSALYRATFIRPVPYAVDVDGIAPTADQVMAASFDPQGVHPWSLKLEHEATRFLHAAGAIATRPDVWSRRHLTHIARADLVAFKGVARFTPRQPCRYGAVGTQEASMVAPGGVTELLTTMVPADPTSKVRHAWRGHRRITFDVTPRLSATQRKVKGARAVKVAADRVGKRGPAVSPWSLSERSIPARMARVDDAAAKVAALESVLRTSVEGATITLTDGTTVRVIDRALSTVERADITYGVRSFARRAVLAAVDVD